MQKGVRPSARMILVIIVMAAAETAWALYAAATSVDLFLVYGVLVAASVVFFVPGIQVGAGAPRKGPAASAETNG